MLDGNSTISCEVLEHCLLENGKQHGVYGVNNFAFKPSVTLRNLRHSGRQTVDIVRSKENCPSTLKNTIDKNFAVGNLRNFRHAYAILHRGRCCGACFARLAMKLQINLMSMILPKCWSICSMVTLFFFCPAPPMTMPTLTEPPWTMAEWSHAISRFKIKKER